MTVPSQQRPPGAHRVWPYQAARLGCGGAAAFTRHGDRQRGLAVSMFLAFLVGGGRHLEGATLTLWRVWPRWSAPVTTVATGAGIARAAQGWVDCGARRPDVARHRGPGHRGTVASRLRLERTTCRIDAHRRCSGDRRSGCEPEAAAGRLRRSRPTRLDPRCPGPPRPTQAGRPERKLLFEPIAVRGLSLIMVWRRQG
jgi:hypothetical protein